MNIPYLAYSELTRKIYIVYGSKKNKVDITDLAVGFVRERDEAIKKEYEASKCKCTYPIRPLDDSKKCVGCGGHLGDK